jgi:hypothetical protein
MAYEEKTTVLLRIQVFWDVRCVLRWLPDLKYNRRRNQRRGNVVYHTQNGVGWDGVCSGVSWLKSNTSFESSNIYWKKNNAAGLISVYIYAKYKKKECSHTLQVSKSQHSSTAVGGLQTFMYITVQPLLT